MSVEDSSDIDQIRAELAATREALAAARFELDVLGAVDAASGLPNRRGVVDAIEAAGNRLDRTGEGFSVLHVSVPALGDLEGDDHREGVRHVAALMMAALRGVDQLGRFDATTFVAVLADAGAAGVSIVAGRLSGVLGALPLRTASGEVSVEASFAAVVTGVRPAPPVDELVGELVEAAKRAEPGPDPVITVSP